MYDNQKYRRTRLLSLGAASMTESPSKSCPTSLPRNIEIRLSPACTCIAEYLFRARRRGRRREIYFLAFGARMRSAGTNCLSSLVCKTQIQANTTLPASVLQSRYRIQREYSQRRIASRKLAVRSNVVFLLCQVHLVCLKSSEATIACFRVLNAYKRVGGPWLTV
jgi:hypothetical protein